MLDSCSVQRGILGGRNESGNGLKVELFRLANVSQKWVKIVNVCASITQEMNAGIEEDSVESMTQSRNCIEILGMNVCAKMTASSLVYSTPETAGINATYALMKCHLI